MTIVIPEILTIFFTLGSSSKTLVVAMAFLIFPTVTNGCKPICLETNLNALFPWIWDVLDHLRAKRCSFWCFDNFLVVVGTNCSLRTIIFLNAIWRSLVITASTIWCFSDFPLKRMTLIELAIPGICWLLLEESESSNLKQVTHV